MTPAVALLGIILAAAVSGGNSPKTLAEAAGMDQAVLEALDRELASGKHGYVDSMLVMRSGAVVYERTYDRSKDYARLFAGKGAPGIYNYYDPGWHPYYKGTRLHTMQSISKSVTSALIGIAIGRGEIPGVGAKVMPYFADFRIPADPLGFRERMTLADVLTMRTGIRWDEETAAYTDPANNCAAMEGSEDWVRYVLEQPMAAEPGKTFVYNSGATELLSYLLAKATREPADDYAKERLFGPLGIRDFYWKRTPKGLADTEGGLYLAPRDLAKIGQLYMQDGIWEGKRILPEGWVKASTTSATPTSEKSFGYGYQWWIRPDAGAYAAWGYGGQFLFVVPRLDLIAIFTGWNIYDLPELDPRFALDRVLAAVREKR
ncbi:MAG TPA: serine hydrolase [Thermoanaerobaculia bacterium]|jgi:CubicO group peptidase (beta-lactamase class C family)